MASGTSLTHRKKPSDPEHEHIIEPSGNINTADDELENHRYSISEEDDDEKHDLGFNTFSFIFVSPVISVATAYAIFIICVQIGILSLVLLNQLGSPRPENLFKIPPRAKYEVIAAQGLAILVTVFVASDNIDALDVFYVKLDKKDSSLIDKFPEAATWKWGLAHILQFIVGTLGIVVSFIFIVQSTEVLELFGNFVVVQFVSMLDDVAFELAIRHLFTSNLLEVAQRIKTVKMSYYGSNLRRHVRRVAYVLLLVTLYTFWGLVRYRQKEGVYYVAECNRFKISFEDKSFDFFKIRPDNIWKNSTRYDVIRGRESEPIRYSSFNDYYYPKPKGKGFELQNNRPVFYQRGFTSFARESDSQDAKLRPPGKISYCKGIKAWVFSIENIYKSPIYDPKDDGCNWLMKSKETLASLLDDVEEEDWDVWTGEISETKVDITCIDCRRPSKKASSKQPSKKNVLDCNYNGYCSNDSVCVCNKDWTGGRCGVSYKCKSFEFEDGSSDILTDKDGVGMIVHDRPVHYVLEAPDLYLILYFGRRYVILELISEDHDVSDFTYLSKFHSAWNGFDSASKPILKTELTKKDSLNGLQWLNYTTDENMGFAFVCQTVF